MEQEPIIVELTDKVRNFTMEGVTYLPGQKFTIPKEFFRADFMNKIADVKVDGMKTLVIESLKEEALSTTEKPDKKGKK